MVLRARAASSNSSTTMSPNNNSSNNNNHSSSVGASSNNNNNNSSGKQRINQLQRKRSSTAITKAKTSTAPSVATPATATVAAAAVAVAVNNDDDVEIESEFETSSCFKATTKTKTTTTTTTYRSSSTSALLAAATAAGTSSCILLRPRTLNVHNARETPTHQTQLFFGEALNAWRAKARCNVVPAERTQELFHELSFHPSHKQISEMLQTAKMMARKGSRQSNGLTFGEFCVLAADLKRFRASTVNAATNFNDKVQLLSSLQNDTNNSNKNSNSNQHTQKSDASTTGGGALNCGTELRSTKSLSNVEDCKKKSATATTTTTASSEPVEVFLGGSCNPTTWRADVAIPALQELGISFYNPQVSDWTPDLIELEHRAKEKARVLFFVMDSETRASAGAIEAAHIAGQNCKQLVLVLHPYKPHQTILNEPISQQEYLDLTRNQLILKELVTRRGLPVLDNIPSGLQRTKEILAGIRDPPTKISSILVVVRGAFNRVNPVNDLLTVEQCQRALSYLGYAQSLLNLDNLHKIIALQRESLYLLQSSAPACVNRSSSSGEEQQSVMTNSPSAGSSTSSAATSPLDGIDFDLFCVVSAYFSVLQQEIHESGCISPIKGTNVPPPPVYFTNAPDAEIYYSSKNISRTPSNASVPSSSDMNERQSLNDLLSRSRDSGTSSPQPLLEPLKSRSAAQLAAASASAASGGAVVGAYGLPSSPLVLSAVDFNTAAAAAAATSSSSPSTNVEDESDSNDSVFSSSSSINSMYNYNYSGGDMATTPTTPFTFGALEFRDVYLGGSCALRTKWRQQIAMPYLKSKGVSFHLPALHESIQSTQVQLPDSPAPAVNSNSGLIPATGMDKVHEEQQRTFIRTRRKCRGGGAGSGPGGAVSNTQIQVEEEEELTVAEETWNWSLSPVVRTNLYNPALLDSSRVILFVITNETRSLAPMTLAAHCIGLMYNVVLAVQMLPDDCVISGEKLTPASIKDYNRGRSYLIDLAKRQGVPVFKDIKAALDCTVAKVNACNNRNRYD